MEGRLSNSEDQVEETDTSVKENIKSKHIQENHPENVTNYKKENNQIYE